ncbi:MULTISPECIES: Na/Pi cotransporter family protein [Chroococcidiopsis]|jgi:phosphate:Na+ symporter|uniref:Na+/Picotransporter n=1 Tax=Chroococcidiopsis thermalis (strain PCC 7203) TaxID=251229 RepID=K9U642_CHRTP|nr:MULTISPECIES: Na/Pi symporter [Chroococcidiopsis]AFY89876.1 Na+/Picotransporter [Chroococcidiopsis thermalis PCC 7203]PSB43302.1 Na/Pi cotransporter family protein [Cyanosarcina cf. burmensis CCALA 770]URD49267.1 Na/Pi symporter [Chroococcidiopsis sp. CCNUC1]
MYRFKNIKSRVLKYFSLSLLVAALAIAPSPFNRSHDFPIAQTTAQAQTPLRPENSSTQFVIAQAPAAKPEPAAAEEKEELIDFFAMGMGALAGLVLFIYGVTRLSEGLEDMGTERMRGFLSKCTTNRFAGVVTGAIATTLLESSSVTIIMTIAMVSAGVLTFVQSLGVVLGANIGTAVGAQIISLDIEQYIPLLMFAGLLLLFLEKTKTWKNLGIVLLGFGLMFYGLEAIDEAMKPFRTYEPFIDLMETLGNNPILGAAVGALFTVIIQSSSATVAIVITLASSGLISLPAGVAIMLGAEVGTCADTLIATIGRGRPALRTGAFHFGFNLVSAILGIIFAPLLVQLVLSFSGGAGVGRQVANAQILFNGIGVLVMVIFLPAIAQILQRLIPDTGNDLKLKPETVQAAR